MSQEKKGHSFAVELTSAQKSKLKGKAHSLRPVIQIGSEGLSDSLLKELRLALQSHELIKVQLPGQSDATAKEQELEKLVSKLPKNTHIVGRIGRTVVVYHELAVTENPKLPVRSLR